jgi:hypothetical protein
MKTYLLSLVLAASLSAGEPRHLIITVAPDLPASARETLGRRVAAQLYEGEPGTRVTVFDAGRMDTVADVTLTGSSLRLRYQRNSPAIVATLNCIRSATNAGRVFNVPLVLDHIGREVRPANASILLLGPLLYGNPKEPSFAMSAGWPSDGHLSAGKERSIFSTVERSHVLDHISVNWLVTDADAVMNESHREGVVRFWSLFIGSQGGSLASVSPETSAVFAAARTGRRVPVMPTEPDPRDSLVVMHSRRIDVPSQDSRVKTATNIIFLTNSVTMTNVVREASLIPRVGPGKAGIAIVWGAGSKSNAPVDLDLYVFVPRDGTELFYRNTRSAHGRYYRDIRQSLPAQDADWKSMWEFVELEGDQMPPEIWINLFSGTGPVSGEVRIQHLGQERVIPFSVQAVAGNYGANVVGRERDPRWVKVRLQPEAGR